MTDPAKFGHDRLGHLLADRLLRVPRFQRQYAWDSSNVGEFLEDLQRARQASSEYFVGTIVLADDSDDTTRQLIVDGQQRLTTTALLLVAIRDRLRELGQAEAAKSIDDTYLKRYELTQEETVTRLILGPKDLPQYDALIDGTLSAEVVTSLTQAYGQCREHIQDLAPTEEDYKSLIEVVTQVADSVQVLLATTSGIGEAYVIFETLNDRGADLTTADLLKNYLFSRAGSAAITYVEDTWTAIASPFERPDDIVKFIRYEYSSRKGKVTNRKLYRAIQEDLAPGAAGVKTYLQGLEKALGVFLALRDPDHPRWGGLSYDVRDSLLALRRFGFESSTPLLLAAFREWGDQRAGKIINLVASWSVRAMMAGKLGGGTAEATFCEAANAVADGSATTQPALRKRLEGWIPDDQEFRTAFLSFGSVTTTRAKYLLGMLERQYIAKTGGSLQSLPDWSPKGVTIEHIIARSSDAEAFEDKEDYEEFKVIRDQIQNLTLLERNINSNLEDKPFSGKRTEYAKSGFVLTKLLASEQNFGLKESADRLRMLADLAVAAWPR